MNLSEFGIVLQFIDSVYQENELQAKYVALLATIQKLSQAPSPEVSTEFKEQTNELIKLLVLLQPKDWGFSKQLIYDQLEASHYMGIGAAQKLKRALSESTADTNSAITKIQALSNELKQYKERLNKIADGMGELLTPKDESPPKGMGLLQLVFDDKVSVETIEDLENIAREWKVILKGLSQVVGDKHNSPSIRKISKNSPLWIEISGHVATLILISKLVEEILNIYLKILEVNELRNKSKAIDILHSVDKEYQNDLKKYKEQELKRIRQEALDEALKGVKNKPKADGNISNWYTIAVEKIYNFIVHGGRVDVAVVGKDNIDVEGEISVAVPGFQFKIAGKYKKIKELETKIGPDRLLIESTVTNNDTLNELETPDKTNLSQKKESQKVKK